LQRNNFGITQLSNIYVSPSRSNDLTTDFQYDLSSAIPHTVIGLYRFRSLA